MEIPLPSKFAFALVAAVFSPLVQFQPKHTHPEVWGQ